MTDAKVLADALVEAGIGEDHSGDLDWYSLDGTVSEQQRAEQYITDWRVAGKVLESMEGLASELYGQVDGSWYLIHDRKQYHYDSLPRAIIEAWYDARQ